MSEPDLNLLTALDALLAEENVAAAARRLGLSASAMSRTLARLRAVTGDPLLVRAGRAMVLTPRALAMRERTRDAVFEAHALLGQGGADLDPATLDRTFVIRANDGFVEAFGAALIAAAARAAPSVLLRFMPKPEKTARPLREGLADLEIGVLVGEMGPEIRLQALFRDGFVGVVGSHHPLAREGAVTATRLVDFGHVVTSRRGLTSGPLDAALAELGLARRIAAVVPGFPAALAVVRASDLVGLVPASFLLNPSAAVHAFALPVDTGTITISQMWHPRAEVDPAQRWLRRLVLDVCHATVPPDLNK